MSEQTTRAYEIVNRYWMWSAAVGFLAVPVVDVAASTGIQLRMIADLARLYGVPFSRDAAKAVVGSLVGSFASPLLAGPIARVLAPALSFLPGVGLAVRVLVAPTLYAASTYALGRVFVQHFESGGTLLDMDPDAVREHYRRELAAAKR
jgi:uncharacterized protein (DUF697 family)